MARFSDLIVKFRGDITGFKQSVRQVNADIASATNQATKLTVGFKGLSDSLTNVGARLTAGVTLPIGAMGKAALDAFGDIDALKRGLTAITGSASETNRQFARLREVARLPGIGLEEAVRGATSLQSLGFSADKARRILLEFGNAVASVGGRREDLDEALRQLTQIGARGKVTMDNLRIVLERVPQLGRLMREEFGTFDTKVLAEQGISADEFFDRILARMEQTARVSGGIRNAFENLGDTAKITLAAIGENLAPAAERFISQFAEPMLNRIQELSAEFRNLPPSAQQAGLELVGFAALVGPLAVGVGVLGSSAIQASLALQQLGASGTVLALLKIGGLLTAAATAAWALDRGINAYIESLQRAQRQKKLEPVSESTLTTLIAVKATLDEIKFLSTTGLAAVASGNPALIFERELKLVQGVYRGARAEMDKLQSSMSLTDEQLLKLTGNFNRSGQVASSVGASFGTQYMRLAEEAGRASDGVKSANDQMKAGKDAASALAKEMRDLGRAMQGPATEADLFSEAVKDLTVSLRSARFRDLAQVFLGQSQFQARTAPLISSDTTGWVLEDNGAAFEAMMADISKSIEQQFSRPGFKKMGEQLGAGFRESSETAKRALREVSTVVTDLSRNIANLIFEGGKFKDVMVNVAKEAGKALTRFVLQEGFLAIGKQLSGLLGKLPALGKLFGSIGSKAAGGAVDAAAGAASSVISTAGKTASSAISSTASGLMGSIGAIGSVVSAVSGIIGNFQMRGMNKSLDLVVKHTLQTANQLIYGLQPQVNRYLPALEGIHERLMQMITNGLGVYPQPGYSWAISGSGGAGLTVHQHLEGAYIMSPRALEDLGDALIDLWRRKGVRP